MENKELELIKAYVEANKSSIIKSSLRDYANIEIKLVGYSVDSKLFIGRIRKKHYGWSHEAINPDIDIIVVKRFKLENYRYLYVNPHPYIYPNEENGK